MNILYTHPQFYDVAMDVIDVKSYKPGVVTLKVRWYNIHTYKHFGEPYKPWMIDLRIQKLELTTEKWKEFKKL